MARRRLHNEDTCGLCTDDENRQFQAGAWQRGYMFAWATDRGRSDEEAHAAAPPDWLEDQLDRDNPYTDTPPVECHTCWGDGVVNEWDGFGVQRAPCVRCFGEGVVEEEE